ncbi:MAG: hypothetical protein IIB42_02575 [Candidatus Marinimicrobia bacterium]|nr:hypothetical protein [Candidatus Neomarinimicrobiota bacterium]
MTGSKTGVVLCIALIALTLSGCATLVKRPVRPAVEPIDPVMGDWQGSYAMNDGSDSGDIVAQVTQPGGIYLQDHRDRVQYRNIWLLEL